MVPKILVIPLIIALVTQTSKLIWFSATDRLTWKRFNLYGGMPSTHTALMMSLTTVIGLQEGLYSPVFALTLILSLVVISDAIGVRRYLGKHSRALNIIVHELPGDEQRNITHFREHFGHTPLEAFVGAVLGITLACVFYMLIPGE